MSTPSAPDFDEDRLRSWLFDYLVANLSCDPDQIHGGATMHDLGVGSRDAVMLTGQLSELLGRPVSPVEFWQYPTVGALATFLTGGEVEPVWVPGAGGRRAGIGEREPIAVVGVGCRFPGGVNTPDDLWDFLVGGRCAVGEVPPDRWEWFADASAQDAAVLAGTTRWGGYLDDVAGFDAEFFEIPSGEADKMDPQQRLLLEVTQEALDDAGIPADSLAETRTGVFAGACSPDYWTLASADLAAVDAWSGTGGALSIIANRLSYFYDLRGPSVTVDTACSSSLVAVHLACQSLRSGESEVALAAGVNVVLSPAPTRGFDVAEMLSPSGRCHAFDAAADGFVRSEGAGVVVLKRLADAVRDGDRVLAVIRGSAVNQDGRSNGLMAPNPASQMAVLREAYVDAGVDVRDVDYVEAHGTGTALGDPIEARALGTVLGRGRSAAQPLLIGSVKSNLGHLEAAAGIAGLIKTVQAVQRGSIPPTVGYQTPNPHIPFDKLRLKVVDAQTVWPRFDRTQVERPRRAGVSSFGFGGTNAHVVVEQAPAAEPSAPPQPSAPAGVTTVVIAGRNAARIADYAGRLAQWWQGPGSGVAVEEVAHTLNHHRGRDRMFATLCARDRGQALAGLSALAAGESAAGVVGPHRGPCRPGTVFVYSGQGSQWAGMGRRLLADEPAFADAVAELEPVFLEQVGFSLRQVLADGEPVHGDGRLQPAIMGIQLALTALWRSYGVHPDAVIGQSMGEVTAAVVAGALTPADGLRVIAVRSRLMEKLGGTGAVALLDGDDATVAALLADYPGVEIAGYLSPRQTVVAGPVGPVEDLLAAQAAANRFARRVNMEVASHTALMDPVCEPLRLELADLAPRIPAIPMFSTVGDPLVRPTLDAGYWVDNMRRPVRLRQAVAAAAAEYATFIEISPNQILTHAIDATLEAALPGGHHHTLGTLTRDADDTVTFHANLNATHTTAPPATPHPPGPHVGLPATVWQHSRHWVSAPPARHRVGGTQHYCDGAVPAEWISELYWEPAPLAEAESRSDGSWLVLGDPALGAELGRLAGNRDVAVASPDLLAHDPDAVLAGHAGITRILYAPAVPADTLDPDAASRIFAEARRLALAMADRPVPPKLIILTRNAQPVEAGDRANPVHAALWGLGRTLALEHPEIWCGIIDLDESVPPMRAAEWVLAEAHRGDGEDQLVYRAGVRRVPRLQPAAPPSSVARLDPGTSHLVVGATGNIGPSLIGQLADMGATTVVAVSRNPGTRLDGLAKTLSERGIQLVTVAADTTDHVAMSALFGRFGQDLPPLAGIYLAAFAGGPVTLRDMTESDVATMFAPKLDAVAVLHRLSLAHPIRQFVLFSSISGVLGSRWLAHYAATTTFLDAFAFARRAAGLPATAINWGLWKSLADNQTGFEKQVTLESGLLPLPDDVAIKALVLAADPHGPVRSTVVAADWPRLAAAYRTRTALHIVDDLLTRVAGDTGTGAASEFRMALEACEPARRLDLLTDHVAAAVAASMGVSADLLDRAGGFFQIGMNSLMSVNLRIHLSQTLGVELPASVVFDYPTVEALAGYLATLLPETAEAGHEDSADDELFDDYDDLAEDELLQKLSERLS